MDILFTANTAKQLLLLSRSRVLKLDSQLRLKESRVTTNPSPTTMSHDTHTHTPRHYCKLSESVVAIESFVSAGCDEPFLEQ